jgi:hypothetical protein
MPDQVFAKVECMAQDKRQPLIGKGAPMFEWSPGVKIEDKGNLTIAQGAEDVAEMIEEANEGANEVFAQDEPDEPDSDESVGQGNNKGNNEIIAEESNREHRSKHNASSNDGEDKVDDVGPKMEDAQTKTEGIPDKETKDDESMDEDQRSEGQTIHNLRPNRGRNYSNGLGHIIDDPTSNKSYDVQLLQGGQGPTHELQTAVQEMQGTGSSTNVLKCMTGIMMTQTMAKGGIKKRGQVGINALFQEFLQLHNLEVSCARVKKN